MAERYTTHTKNEEKEEENNSIGPNSQTKHQKKKRIRSVGAQQIKRNSESNPKQKPNAVNKPRQTVNN